MEKHIEQQRPLFHNFIDFKKAFDRVWHQGLWDTMASFGIDTELINIIRSLYESTSSSVLLTNQIGPTFCTKVGVRQGCLLSPQLFNIFLERIMQVTLQNHESSIKIGGRQISNLRFADDIDSLAGSEAELQSLPDSLEKASTSFGMEISHSKSKTLVNGETQAPKIMMYGKALENVSNFKYLGATLSDDATSKKEICIRLATATSVMVKLEKIWRSKEIVFKIKCKLYKSLVLSTLLYGCETWTLYQESKKRISAFETKAFRRLLQISYREHKTNLFVRAEIEKRIGHNTALLDIVLQRKLSFYGHISRHDNLCKTIMQGYVEGKRNRGRPKRNWMNDLTEYTHLSLGIY